MIDSLCIRCYAFISAKSKRKFCSRHCANSYNNKLQAKRKPEGKCKVCSKSIRTSISYCSDICKQAKLAESKLRRRRSNVLFVKQRRKKLKELAISYKGGKCQICGYDKCVDALQFHHLDPSIKDFGISDKGLTRSWERTKIEVDKCVLLCGNCHAEIHAGVTKLAQEEGIEPPRQYNASA